MVSAAFREYNDLFLFSLALVNGLEIVQLQLSALAGEAAFALSEVWTRGVHGDDDKSQKAKTKKITAFQCPKGWKPKR